MFEKEIEDKELGTILLISGPRYKRYALRVKEGVVRATMPLGGDEKQMMAFIEANRAKLAGFLAKPTEAPSLIDGQNPLITASFRMELLPMERTNMAVSLAKGVLTVEYPAHIPLTDARIQQRLKEILKNVFRHEAKRLLPGRVEELARQYGFEYNGVAINSARTRWGSCSSRKHLNLSLYLMQLPWHLIDYVILHELCHTREMNHSDRFWAQMDRVTDNRSKALRQELKTFKIV